MPSSPAPPRGHSDAVIRLTIHRKVFLATLALVAATALLLVLATRWNLEQGFARYSAAVEIARLGWLVDKVERAYAERGGWEFLQEDPQAWRRLQRPSNRGEQGPPGGALEPGAPRPPPPPPRDWAPEQADNPPPRFRPPPPPRPGQAPANDPFNIAPRLALFDAAGRQLAGHGREADASRPILHQGQVVGQLTLQAAPASASILDTGFLASQTRNLLLSGLIALVLALLAAWWLVRHLLAPVKDLTSGARAIAGGCLTARIPVRRADELGELAADFNAMAEQLARAEEARRAWVADTSHELRTPLAVLRAEIEALQDGVRQPDEATLARLHRQVLQLAKLVDDLRSTLDGNAMDSRLVLAPLQPLALLNETVGAFRSRYAAAGLRIKWAAPKDGGWTLDGDGDRLRQVFVNLLENTLRYTAEGGSLRIAAGVKGARLCLAFDDSVPAPPRDALPRLFDRFYRAEPSRNREHGGSGLGLSICKAIIEAHGGNITAGLSDLGGLAIRIELPLEEQA